MFAEKVCEQVVGFSVMAEDELFEVNGGYQADAAAGSMGGSKNGAGGTGTVINGHGSGSGNGNGNGNGTSSTTSTSGDKSPIAVGNSGVVIQGDVGGNVNITINNCTCGC